MKLLTLDGLEVEATKEQIKQIEVMREPVWERYDSWEKCFVKTEPRYWVDQMGRVTSCLQLTRIEVSKSKSNSTNLNRQKAILAYLQLSVIAEVWNGEILNAGFAVSSNNGYVIEIGQHYGLYVFFKTPELASKSFELFPELYEDLKNANL